MKKAIVTMVLLAVFSQAMVFAQNARWAEVRVYFRWITQTDNFQWSTTENVQAIDERNAEGLATINVQSSLRNVTRAIFVRWFAPGEYEQRQQQAEERRAEVQTDRAEQWLTVYNTGSDYYDKGDYYSAIDNLTAAIRLRPDFFLAYTKRGEAYFQIGNFDRAIADFTETIRRTGDISAYRLRARAYNAIGAWDRAIADATECIQDGPNNAIKASGYNERATAYFEKGDLNRAIADATEAIRLDPNHVLYSNRADIYIERNDLDRAIADLTQAIRLAPNNALYYNNRAFAYFNKRDWDRAITDATAAIRLDPNYPNPYRTRGRAYVQKNNFTQARADANRALQLDPNNQIGKDLDADLRRRGY